MGPGNPNDNFNKEAFKHAIGMLESSGGKFLKSNSSSAAGKYHFLWNLIKNNKKLKGLSKREFIANPQLQEEIMDDALSGKLEGYPNYMKYAKTLKSRYNTKLNQNEIAALTHFLGAGNVKKYLSNPDTFKVPGKNMVPSDYVGKFRGYFDKYNENNKAAELIPESPKVNMGNIKEELYKEQVQQPIDNTAVFQVPDTQKDIEMFVKRQNELNKLKMGGEAGFFDEGLVRFESGGTHEENSIGGIPQGIGANGKPNLVEEGETKWGSYVFSNSITIGGEIKKINQDANSYEYGGDLNKNKAPKQRLLRSGSVGEDVKAIQSYLGLKEDGIFGKNTRKAVMDFQTKNNLKADGIVGKNTMKAFSDYFMKNKNESIKEEDVVPKLELFKGEDSKEKDIKNISRNSLIDYLPKKDNTLNNKPFFRALDKDLAKKTVNPLSEKELQLQEKKNKSNRVRNFQKTLKDRLGIGTSAIDGKWGKKTQSALDELKAYVNSDLDKSNSSIFKSIKSAAGVRSGNLNEDNFSKGELDVMRKAIFQGGKMKNSFNYDDIRKGSKLENLEVTDFISNPIKSLSSMNELSINLVLGSASVVEDENGDVYVYDIYDFNDVGNYGKNDKRTPDEVYEDRIKYAESQGDMSGLTSIYSKLRANASKNQRQEQIEASNKNKKWKPKVALIKLGNKKDLIKKFGSSNFS